MTFRLFVRLAWYGNDRTAAMSEAAMSRAPLRRSSGFGGPSGSWNVWRHAEHLHPTGIPSRYSVTISSAFGIRRCHGLCGITSTFSTVATRHICSRLLLCWKPISCSGIGTGTTGEVSSPNCNAALDAPACYFRKSFEQQSNQRMQPRHCRAAAWKAPRGRVNRSAT